MKIGILPVLFFVMNVSLAKKADKTFKEHTNTFECTASLAVNKDKSVKSFSKDYLDYKLELINTSSRENNYQIEFENLDSEEIVEFKKSQKKIQSFKTVNLKASLVSKTKEATQNIILKPNEKFLFTVRIHNSKKLDFEKWNFTKVNLISKNCKDVVASIILKTYIPNPSLR